MVDREQKGVGGPAIFDKLPEYLRQEVFELLAAKPEWGIRVRPGLAGLRLGDLNAGSYGEVRDTSSNRSLRARGSLMRQGQVPANQGYYIVMKTDVWSDNAAALYEEAIQRRWIPATDIPWLDIGRLPEDIELAVCQICTTLCSFSSALATAVGKHLQNISYEFHEVKCFLATECFDHARHIDAFRKRALVNGGGLLVPPSFGYKTMLEERDWVGATVELHLIVESFLRTFLEACEFAAPHAAEKKLFGLAMQDLTRHIDYGMGHIRYMLSKQPERSDELTNYLLAGEQFVLDEYFGQQTWEALAILMGGGVERYEEGLRMVEAVRKKMVRDYVSRLETLGFDAYVHPEGRRGMRYRLRRLLEQN